MFGTAISQCLKELEFLLDEQELRRLLRRTPQGIDSIENLFVRHPIQGLRRLVDPHPGQFARDWPFHMISSAVGAAMNRPSSAAGANPPSLQHEPASSCQSGAVNRMQPTGRT
jgi:hypothetical protein